MDSGRKAFFDELPRVLRKGFRLSLALLGATGIGATLASTLSGKSGAILLAGIVRFFFYFTIQSTLAVTAWLAIVTFGRRTASSAQAARRRDLEGPGVHLALLTSSILTAGGYYALLAGTWNPRGLAAFGDVLVHGAVPAMMVLDWILFQKKGSFRLRHVAGTLVLPSLHLLLAMVRGAVTGEYPYPFLDPGRIGTAAVLWNTAALSAFLIVGAAVLVGLDRGLGAMRRGREGAKAEPDRPTAPPG